MLKIASDSAALRCWRESGAKSMLAARSSLISTYRKRWGCATALHGARLRLSRRVLVGGQPAGFYGDMDPGGPSGGFDPSSHAAYTHASVPTGRGAP